ncbi:MAG: glycosyltransferase [Clostridiales bacterium]|nr:glycosyltransferase [Clostridiales bacterium]
MDPGYRDKVLTVSIAAYNTGATLERTLASLDVGREITEKLDIMIIDDGSTDDTVEVARRFARRSPDSVRIISKENGGYGSTVNTALREARGRYFKLLDGDDTFDRHGLEGLVRYLDEGCSADLVITPYIIERLDADGRPAGDELCDRHQRMQTSSVAVEEACLDDGLSMFEICVRTDVMRRSGVQLTENCFYTDNEYVIAAELYAENAVRYREPVYRYSLGVPGQSMSVEGRKKHCQDKVKAADGVFDIYEGYIEKRYIEKHACSDKTGRSLISGARRMLTDKMISTMVREIYVTWMLLDDPAARRKELADYSGRLKAERPEIYEISRGSRLVRMADRAGDTAYSVLCRYVAAAERRRTGAADSGVSLYENSIYNNQKSALKTAEYIAAACMIIQCRTVYMHLRDVGMIVNRSVWVVMMIALAACVVIKINEGTGTGRAWIRKTALICTAFAVYAGVFLAVNPVNPLRVIRCALAVIMMIILARSPGGKEKSIGILGCFRDLMVIIAVISLAGWVTGSILKVLPCTAYLDLDWSATGGYVRIPTFMCIYFETQWTNWTLVQARNTGIFTEAPMAACAYSVALMTECLAVRGGYKEHRRNVTILAVAILSTMSMIGYGFLVLMILFRTIRLIASSRRSTGYTAAGKAAVLLTAGVITAIVVILAAEKMGRPSGFVRVNDFVVGFKAWMAHPVFGGGFEDLSYLQSFMPYWRFFDTGFSNSPMEILAQGGIWLGAPYIYAFISALVRSIRRRDMNGIAFTVMFVYIFTFIVIPYQYITFFIIIFTLRGFMLRDAGETSPNARQMSENGNE